MINKTSISSSIAAVLLTVAFNASAESVQESNQATDRSIEVSELSINGFQATKPVTSRKAGKEPARVEMKSDTQEWFPDEWTSTY